MKPLDLRTLNREECLFVLAHEMMHRIMEIEPHAVVIDHSTGNGSLLTVTPEGKFLSMMLHMIDEMKATL